MRTPLERSPYDLMQERLRRRPWSLLVGCLLYNKVRGRHAWPYLAALLRKWPAPEAVVFHNDDDPKGLLADLEDLLRPLGLQRRRAKLVVALALAFRGLDTETCDVLELPGCGRYAAESFEIFHRGRLVPRPQDKELRRYVNWARSKARRGHS